MKKLYLLSALLLAGANTQATTRFELVKKFAQEKGTTCLNLAKSGLNLANKNKPVLIGLGLTLTFIFIAYVGYRCYERYRQEQLADYLLKDSENGESPYNFFDNVYSSLTSTYTTTSRWFASKWNAKEGVIGWSFKGKAKAVAGAVVLIVVLVVVSVAIRRHSLNKTKQQGPFPDAAEVEFRTDEQAENEETNKSEANK